MWKRNCGAFQRNEMIIEAFQQEKCLNEKGPTVTLLR